MKYIPTVISNKWVTALSSGNGNKGIHSQRKFKEGVAMLEAAINTWHAPKMQHLVLTHATLETYAAFVNRLKRNMGDTLYDYKGCTELDKHKGQHQHFMWLVDTEQPDNLFNLDDSASAISRAMAATQRTEPAFNVTLCEPQHYSTTYVPLSSSTLQDAADYLSYIYKARSKPSCHRYMGSRASRKPCCHRSTTHSVQSIEIALNAKQSCVD